MLAGLDRHELLHGPDGARRRRSAATGAIAGADRGRRDGRADAGDTIRAYIALTKPRIIELLLVTTVPGDGPRHARRCPASRLGRLGLRSSSGR